MKKMIAYSLIGIGVLLIIGGGVLLSRNGSNQTESKAKPGVPTEAASSLHNRSKFTSSAPASETEKNEASEKGVAFEKFVVTKFDKRFFKIKEWQGDKYHEGYYAENNKNPDLVIEHMLKDQQNTFAIECKWRSNTNIEVFDWCTDEQLEHYKKYSEEKGLPVFVVIGLGGQPMTPAEVYVVPLRRMKYADVKRQYLQAFKREDVNRDFVYDGRIKFLK
jgi:hypothetical protein